MMFTKQQRQEIVREFALRHNGHYNPKLFVEEVERTGEDHPAYGWFTWNDRNAADAFRLEQARDFARDLRITFKIEEVGRTTPVRVRETEMPLAISPMNNRSKGGGYFITDPNDPGHMKEHCRQAAISLQSWLDRYQAALQYAGRRTSDIEKVILTLENAQTIQDEVA